MIEFQILKTKIEHDNVATYNYFKGIQVSSCSKHAFDDEVMVEHVTNKMTKF